MSKPTVTPQELAAFAAAIAEASERIGATAPNPPVGAAALSAEGRVLGVAAHEGAGHAHAEGSLLEQLARGGSLASARTQVVTLGPCNHRGRTPPSAEAILGTGIRRVLYGVADPNPRAAGGAERLRAAGLEALELPPGPERARCEELLRPFRAWISRGTPWVRVKTARRLWDAPAGGTMLPPPGSKTFTTRDSLLLAHSLRKRADAIITGSGTVLADDPLLTVREVPDHPGKRRHLLVLDRRQRVPEGWFQAARARGLLARRWSEGLRECLQWLGKAGCLEALVEAGPELSQAFLRESLWDEHVVITQERPGGPDRVEVHVHRHC
jgi:diaminohydroxyphosphoribosylaminopyrimidine deaminase / 5-amino-6-(5-phosphoribosylamino)uracil reductase